MSKCSLSPGYYFVFKILVLLKVYFTGTSFKKSEDNQTLYIKAWADGDIGFKKTVVILIYHWYSKIKAWK